MTTKKSIQRKTFSVVVAASNRPKLLKLCLDSLLNLDYGQSKIELIIVITSDHLNREVLQSQISKFKDVTVLSKIGASCGEARNLGGFVAKHDYVVFLDDDAKVSPQWLYIANEIIQAHNPVVFGGPIYPFYLSKKPRWFKDTYEIRSFGNISKWLESDHYLSGSNLFIQKDILKAVGGTRKDLGMKLEEVSLGEDTELQLRIAKNFPGRYYHPELQVFHYVPTKKMKVSYKVRRLIALGRYDQRIESQSIFKIIFKFIFELFIQILLLLRFSVKFLNNRVRLQRHLWENTTKPFYWWGRLIQ